MCVGAAVWATANPHLLRSQSQNLPAGRRRINQKQMLMLLSLRSPPAAAHLGAAATARTPPLSARRTAGPPPASASASAEFPGIILLSLLGSYFSPPSGTRSCRRRPRKDFTNPQLDSAELNPGANAGSIPDSAQMPPRRQRRRSVAGIDQDELLDPDALADPDSSFYEINGVRLHHKVCSHEDEDEVEDSSSGSTTASDAIQKCQIGLPILLLHGFGASVFSWSRVMRPLARIVRAKVLAFDRPAFGLTSRASWSGDDTKPLNPYSMAFSVMATLAFIDYLRADKAILVGY